MSSTCDTITDPPISHMANIRFILHRKRKDGHISIRLVFLCEDGKLFRLDTGEHIVPRQWSKKSHRPLPSAPGAFKLIAHLDALEERVQTAIRTIRLRGQRTTPALIKSELSGESMGLWEYWEKFMENPPQEVGPGTLKIYARLFKNLPASLSFVDVGQSTIESYIKGRRDKGINDSTVRTELNKFRAFLNYARRDRVIKVVPEFEINVNGVDPGEIYLNEAEIKSIYALIGTDKLKSRDQHMERSIMIFVLGTQIGVRVSDLKITPENIVEKNGKKYLNLSTRKTSDAVIVPLSPLALEILQFFEWTVPALSDVRLNVNIKVAGELAEINEPAIWREKINGKVVETVMKKYQLISSHTMRRSFATNLYLKGAPSVTIMKITGHKTESSFLKYIRISKQEAAEAIGEYF